MSERDILADKIEQEIMPLNMGNPNAHNIADFILADRKRIVEPLVNFKPTGNDVDDVNRIAKAIEKTVRLADGGEKG